MKIALMHPYRHHSYNIVEAISHTNNEITAFYGYYNKDNLIYRSLERVPNNKIISKFLGYNDANIDKYVQTNIISKLLFLQSKVNNSKSNKFTEKFDNYCYSKVNKFDTLIFLQDHCQKALDNAFDKNKKVIYDHILPCGYKQRKILLSECEQLGIGPGYADKYMPEEKIEKNYINISKANIILNASYSTYSIAEEVLGIEEAKKRSFLLPYGSNFNSFDKESFNNYLDSKIVSQSKRKMKILYVGSIGVSKGIRVLIETIKKLDSKEVEFGIVGVLNQEEDNIFLDEINKLDNVKYYGAVPHKIIGEIYKQYDMFIFTSIIEGFGMVTLEAMSYGLPCIVNKFCKSVVENNSNGYVVKEYCSDDYVSAIRYILNNKEKLAELSQNAYQTSQIYSWSRYQKELIGIIENL